MSVATKEKQTAKILRLLKTHEGGLTNLELNRVAFRYSARIYDLRKEGHNIQAVQEKQGVWRFVLKEDE